MAFYGRFLPYLLTIQKDDLTLFCIPTPVAAYIFSQNSNGPPARKAKSISLVELQIALGWAHAHQFLPIGASQFQSKGRQVVRASPLQICTILKKKQQVVCKCVEIPPGLFSIFN
jgi:hypothetical protein